MCVNVFRSLQYLLVFCQNVQLKISKYVTFVLIEHFSSHPLCDLNTAEVMSSAPSTSNGQSATTSAPINREYPEPSAPSIDLLSSDIENNAQKPNAPTDNKDKQVPNLDKESKTKDSTGEKKDESVFECNICLDTAKDAVVSLCGHLFCWPCLHQWLETRPTRQLCPVCKAAISKDKVIPLYGRGSTKEDPR